MIFRVLNETKYHIKRILNFCTWFCTANMVVLALAPFLERNKRLPFETWTPIDVTNNNFAFVFFYLFQIGCTIFVGGANIIVNMYVLAVMVFLNFSLALFSSRLLRLGYLNGKTEPWTDLPKQKISYYCEIIHFVQLHLKIDE